MIRLKHNKKTYFLVAGKSVNKTESIGFIFTKRDKMREVIHFIRQSGLQDAQGGYTETTTTTIDSNIFASVELSDVQRNFDGSVLDEKQTYKVKCRSLDVVNVIQTDLIEWNGKILAINTFKQTKKQDFYTEFRCTDYNG